MQQQYNGSGQISISLKKGEKFFFTLLGAVCTGRDFIDPYNESDREVIYGAKEGLTRLMDGHRKLWNEMWKGDIVIEGMMKHSVLCVLHFIICIPMHAKEVG